MYSIKWTLNDEDIKKISTVNYDSLEISRKYEMFKNYYFVIPLLIVSI